MVEFIMTLVLTTAIQSWPQFLCTSYHILQTWLRNMRKHVDNDDPSIMTVITILLVNTQHVSVFPPLTALNFC